MAQANLEIVLRQHPLEKAKHSADILQNQMGDTGQTDGTYQQHQHREGNPVLPAAGDKRHQRQDAKERCAQPDGGTRQRSDEGSGTQDEPCQQDDGAQDDFQDSLAHRNPSSNRVQLERRKQLVHHAQQPIDFLLNFVNL